VEGEFSNEHIDFKCHHPEIVITDNGTNFASKEFEDFLKQHGIHHFRTAPCHPASNGVAERVVQTLWEGMKMNGGDMEIYKYQDFYLITESPLQQECHLQYCF